MILFIRILILFLTIDINFSKLSELVEHIQEMMVRNQQESSSQIEQFETNISNFKSKLENISSVSKSSGNNFQFELNWWEYSISESNVQQPSGISDLVKTIQATIGNLESNSKSWLYISIRSLILLSYIFDFSNYTYLKLFQLTSGADKSRCTKIRRQTWKCCIGKICQQWNQSPIGRHCQGNEAMKLFAAINQYNYYVSV